MTVLMVVEGAILIVLCILVAGLLRAYAAVLQRLHQLDGPGQQDTGRETTAPPFRTAGGVVPPAAGRSAAGTSRAGAAKSAAAPSPAGPEWGPGHDISGVGLTGEIISLRTQGTGTDTVLVFLSSGCTGCTGFWEDFAQRREMSLAGRVLVVTKGPDAESIGLLRELCPAGVDLVMSSRAWEDYGVPGSPYVVVVDGDSGRIKGEGSGTSLTQVSGLVRQSLTDRTASAQGRVPVKPRSDADREVDVDRVLLAAGISPGHSSLYASSVDHVPAEPDFIGLPGRRSGSFE